MKVIAIVPAAGKGRRLKKNIDKPFILLNKRPLLSITLKALEKSNFIREIVVACAKDSISKVQTRIVKKYKLSKVSLCIAGGKTRQESVYKALTAIKDKKCKLVLIHDAARPFIAKDIIDRACKSALRFGSGVVGIPASDTIKEVRSNCVSNTLNRKLLWQIQTPQVFKKELILKAYERFYGKGKFSDDASLVERMKVKVRMVKGSSFNIKVTTPEDIIVAEYLDRIIRKKC